MINKAVCKMLAVSIALAIVASGIVVNASSTSDISNDSSVTALDVVVMANAQDSTSYSFKELGYKTSTYSGYDESVSIDFDSPYEEASGDLNLHLNLLAWGFLEVKINGATLLQEKRFDEGEHWEKIDIPTGMIDEGTNTLTISFPSYNDGITLLANSKINIIGKSINGTTFEDFGYKTSTYSGYDESVSIDFDSPYEEASGDLNLHLNLLAWGFLEVKINGATLLSKKIDEGEHWEKIEIPTGMIDEGTNTLTICFPSYSDGITLLANSKINIIGTYLTFSYFPENPIIDEIITFNASTSYKDITSYEWDFGDGTTAIGEAVTHYYPSSEEYNVTLTVTRDGDQTDTIIKTVLVGISRWQYDVTVEESKEETKKGDLTMTFSGWEPIGGFNAAVFYIANTVPAELSNYKLILANTGASMEKYVTKEDRSYYAKLLPINPQENRDIMWSEGASLLTNISIPSNPGLGQATQYYITGVEDLEVLTGNFRCFHVKARYDASYGGTRAWSSVDEWWDEAGRGLIQAKYTAGAGYMGTGLFGGVNSTTWEYRLNNSTDSLFPINYRGI